MVSGESSISIIDFSWQKLLWHKRNFIIIVTFILETPVVDSHISPVLKFWENSFQGYTLTLQVRIESEHLITVVYKQSLFQIFSQRNRLYPPWLTCWFDPSPRSYPCWLDQLMWQLTIGLFRCSIRYYIMELKISIRGSINKIKR